MFDKQTGKLNVFAIIVNLEWEAAVPMPYGAHVCVAKLKLIVEVLGKIAKTRSTVQVKLSKLLV